MLEVRFAYDSVPSLDRGSFLGRLYIDGILYCSLLVVSDRFGPIEDVCVYICDGWYGCKEQEESLFSNFKWLQHW